jgi:N12 class adenine-specific DNA methylase/adenine-specific DNA methylase/superfamily II DNA/RNA helicase
VTRLADLYAASVQEYTKTPGEWKGLLSCVARFYKRSFDNAVLIYAQRPNATQLGTFDEWHDRRIGRSINRGAKSIAVIDMENPNASIKYLFDFLDTNGSVQSYRNLQRYLWELEEQYRPEILMRFRRKYGLPAVSMEECLYQMAGQRVREILPAYLEDFQVTDEGSPLYGMPTAAVKAEFSALVEESVAYVVFSKCGLPTEQFDDKSFENIRNYNSPPLFMALGNCTVSIARPILREVYQEIQDIKDERSKDYEDRTVDEPYLPTGQGRDDVPRTSDFHGRTERPNASGQVRQSVEGVYDGKTPAPPFRTGGAGEDKRNDPAGQPGGGEAEGGVATAVSDNTADAGNGGHDGAGGASRHDYEGSGGNRDKRSGAKDQVIPQSGQVTQPSADEKKPSAGGFFVVPPRTQNQTTGEITTEPGQETPVKEEAIPEKLEQGEEKGAGNNGTPKPAVQTLEAVENNALVDSVLCADDLTPDAAEWLKEIAEFYQKNDDPELRAHVLRLFYRGMDRNYTTKSGEYSLRTIADGEKLTIQEGKSSNSYTYEKLSKRVEQLIRDGSYPYPEMGKQTEGQEKQGESQALPVKDEGEENAEQGNNETENVSKEVAGEKNIVPKSVDEKSAGRESERDARQGNASLPMGTPNPQDIIDYYLSKQTAYQGGKQRIYEAMTTLASPKDRTDILKKEYGIGGLASSLDNGGHIRIMYDTSGFEIDYSENGMEIQEHLTWKQVEKRIMELIQKDMYLSGEEKAELKQNGKYYPDGKLPGRERPEGEQLSLFELGIGEDDGDNTRADSDAMLDTEGMLDGVAIPYMETVPDRAAHPEEKENAQEIDGQALLSATTKPPQSQYPVVQPTATNPNYHFSEDHHLYDGGAKTKCQNNIAAIRLLKELQAQNRMATAEEQTTLAKFVGWGGLANALTPGRLGWESQYGEIKNLLTEEEFAAAQESTLTAYYTEQGIIQHIYDALGRFGFHGGNILDPAMGTGNFFSVLPESMGNSRLYGVEIEPVSGNIARQLYPEADIQITGFETTDYPNQFFDIVIGNIPFNAIRVNDPKYNRYNFRIHDYFLAKSLDKLRPGGILAAITSKYTMDKANPTNRKYLAQRAELIGAIRLPNNAFQQVAGTETTTDILFLQKREWEIVPDEKNSPWLFIEENIDGIPMNRYFIDHPEMVLGEIVFDERVYGNEKATACHPIPGDDLHKRLGEAVSCLKGKYHEPESGEEAHTATGRERQSIPADPAVRNFSYTLVDGKLYYREHSRMYPQDMEGKKAGRIRGLVGVTKSLRALIDFQNEKESVLGKNEYESALKYHIEELNRVYDRFVTEYGYLNSRTNVTAFSQDANAPLLRSIEKERKEEKGVYDKTAVFYKATIHQKSLPAVVFSAGEALKVSLNVKGKVDLGYMAGLYQKPDGSRASTKEIIAELDDQIYQDPVLYGGNPNAGWQTAGEYLSGHVREKLAEAVLKAEEEPGRFARNVEALKKVQPAPLTAQEIRFSLGTPWIPVEVYQEFMYETFQTRMKNQWSSHATAIEYSKYSGAYFITNKGNEGDSLRATTVYGTGRINAYEILEASLNLRFVEVRDKVKYTDPATGEVKEKYVLNKKETILAREKQAQIKAEFEKWLFSDPQRGERMVRLYNDRFNNIRPREYDGSDLVLPDLAGDIKLRKHQLDVVAHGLYGEGNLLMAHEVGAGKTYAAIVLAHEMKRLGKANKPLIAVPNHLVGQWSDAYMELYPNANLLVAAKRDFEKQNRRRFVSRIATGDYDCIIMAHSSFELIGLSREWQLAAMQTEMDAVTKGIYEQKNRAGENWSLKQMKIFKKNLQTRIDKLFSEEKKDDTINFEELGVDALIVDEAHAYKNNFSYTKMRNVAGISSQGSQRAMDMHQKCQYINEISNGRNVIYLTGTPVSNSMAELYVMQKTLQPQELERRGLLMFDEWAATFGKVTSSLEIKPEGNGYQMKNRFAQFHNLPELMGMFAMVADIKTADMLNLPTPKLKTGAPQVIKSVCTPDQKRIVMELAERAEAIRNGSVDSSEDNFLKLTNEARLLSTDPRAIDPNLPDDPDTKLNLCAKNVAGIYKETAEKQLTQLIFCDQGTPKYDGSFNFYEAMKKALVGYGVTEAEVAFIHNAKTDLQREQLFEKVRSGEIRILMGSTEKMGTGMNVQQKLIALHHLDVPWRPSDLIQRNGRILRQGNENEEVSIYNYITENTFDAYLWQILEQKQRYISQIMTGRSALRTCEDMDETVLQYAQFKAMAASDPRVKEKMETDNEIGRLMILKSSWKTGQIELSKKISKYPEQMERKEKWINILRKDLETYRANKPEEFRMVVGGREYTERAKAAEHFLICTRRLGVETGASMEVGSYAGFSVRLVRKFRDDVEIQLCGKGVYQADCGESELGNITRIVNLAERLTERLEDQKAELENLKLQMETAKREYGKPFPEEERLLELQKKKVQLDLALEFKDGGEDMVASGEDGEDNQGRNHRKPLVSSQEAKMEQDETEGEMIELG